jgi:hypothetical protein
MNSCILCYKQYPAITESKLPEYSGTCSKCRKMLLEEAPGIPLHGYGGSSVEALIEELEFRMPSIFNGPECPLDHVKSEGCACTYETGCLALKSTKKSGSPLKRITKQVKID